MCERIISLSLSGVYLEWRKRIQPIAPRGRGQSKTNTAKLTIGDNQQTYKAHSASKAGEHILSQSRVQNGQILSIHHE